LPSQYISLPVISLPGKRIAPLELIAIYPPDLVLPDVRMPGIDGFETYRRLRAMEGREDLPVIFVTAEGDVEMESKGAAMGGIDDVTKPIQREVLLALVRSRLQR
jgi:DNA-binding response OmpR family regulator